MGMMNGGGGSLSFVGGADPGEDQALTLRAIVRDVRRSLPIIVVLALVGLVAGIAYAVARPSLPSASSQVLLPASATNAQGQPIQGQDTDVQIALSQAVLEPAGRVAGLSLPYRTLQQRVTVTTPAPNILQITASDPSARGAEHLANAVASQFLAYVNSPTATESIAVAALTDQVPGVELTISEDKADIGATRKLLAAEPPGSAEASNTRNLLNQYQNNYNQFKGQLAALNANIDHASLNLTVPAAGATLLASATSATRPSVGRTIGLAMLGALAGLIVGIVLSLVRARLDRRLRSRDDIARAAGLPVLASMWPKHPHRVADWQHLFDSWTPTLAESARLSRVLQDLASLSGPNANVERSDGLDGPTSNGSAPHSTVSILEAGIEVTVIVLAGDVHAQAMTVELAAYGAWLGVPVSFTVRSGETVPAKPLRIAIERRVSRPDLHRENLSTDEGDVEASDSKFTIKLLVLDPEVPGQVARALSRKPVATALALLVVTAGYATPEQIADVVEISEEEGLHLIGVVVADPDHGDMTTGRPRAARVPRHERVGARAERQP